MNRRETMPTTHDADVIVVGGGPAGATAAIALRQHGRDVLLVDRAEFPRDKTCGDGVPPGSISVLNELGLGDEIAAAGFYPIHGIRLGSPRGRLWETDLLPRCDSAQFYIAPRRQFDHIIFARALDLGASFERANVRGPVVSDGRVTGVRATQNGSEVTFRAPVVIAADGATSSIARGLSGTAKHRDAHRGVALRAYAENIELIPNRVEFYFYRQFFPGYGWVFPMGGRRANVGVIMRADAFRRKRRTLKALLADFLETPAVRGRFTGAPDVHDASSWQLNYAGGEKVRRVYDGALLVGDAGGFVDALTGEGIHNAVISGRIAADVTHAGLAAGDTSARALARYDAECDRDLGHSIRRAHRFQKWCARFPLVVEPMFWWANRNPAWMRSFINQHSTDFMIPGV